MGRLTHRRGAGKSAPQPESEPTPEPEAESAPDTASESAPEPGPVELGPRGSDSVPVSVPVTEASAEASEDAAEPNGAADVIPTTPGDLHDGGAHLDEPAEPEPEPVEEPAEPDVFDLFDADPHSVLPQESDDARDDVRWTLPAAPDDVAIQEPPYRGRPLAGEVGAMLRVPPSVRSKLPGAHVPDSIVDAAVVSEFVSIGAVSIKGASHHYSAMPRQDTYTLAFDRSWMVFAIADGVSSGRLSHVAANEASRVAVSETIAALAQQSPDIIDWARVADRARQSVRALAQRRAQHQVGEGAPAPQLSDHTIAEIMATTCDLLIVPLERVEGSLRVTRVRISGDGSFYVLDPTRGWGLLGSGKDPDSASIDNSVSDPLPIAVGAPDVTHWELEPGQAAVLCTDGFGDVIGTGARPVGRFLFDAWREPLDTTQLLWSSSFVNTNADDDRTAVIVWAVA